MSKNFLKKVIVKYTTDSIYFFVFGPSVYISSVLPIEL